MAFCRNCGKEIENTAVVCPHCGVPQNIAPPVEDNGGFLWGLLGFGVPVAGLVIYLVWKDIRPKTAKAAGKGALIATILWLAYGVVICAVMAVIFTMIIISGVQ